MKINKKKIIEIRKKVIKLMIMKEDKIRMIKKKKRIELI
jgi:hypothetical protein